MTDLKLKALAKCIIQENLGETVDFLALQLYNSALSSPPLNVCKETIKQVMAKQCI